jgi:4-hydroxy-tetrahydrodipicolinate synthase
MIDPASAGWSSKEVGLHPVAPDVFSPRGVYAPTITAFEKNENVSLAGTRAFVRFLLGQGVDGLVPLGSSGEPLALTMDERKAVLDAVATEAAGKVPIMAGIVEYSTRAAIEFGQYAKSAGCKGLMVMPPYGVRPPKRDVFDHLRRVRESVGLPVMLYNVPSASGIDLMPEEVQQLAEEGVVQSVKWSTGEVSRIRDTKFLCGPSFPVFVGHDLIAFEGLVVGADGWISALLRGIPVGQSRKPLSSISREHAGQLRELLVALREI